MLARRWLRSFPPALPALAVAALLTLPVLAESPKARVVPAGENGPGVFWFGDVSRAYLGVQLEEEIDHPEGGARVTEVVADSPAARAGIEVGDIIVRFEEKTIRGPAALTKWIHEKEPGERIEIVVVRDGRKAKLAAELAERPGLPGAAGNALERLNEIAPRLERLPALRFGCEDDDCTFFDLGLGGPPLLGVQLVETTPELREHLGGDAERGVLVSKVLPGMPAEHAGVHVGDLIVEVDGEPVGSTRDLRAALRDRAGTSFSVELVRDGSPISLDVTLPDREQDRPTGPRARLRLPAPVQPPSPAAAPPAPAATPSPAPFPQADLPPPPAPTPHGTGPII